MSDIWLFVTGLAVVYLIPGPDMLLILDTALYKGRVNAFLIASGLAAARTVHVFLSGAGLASIGASFPQVWPIVHFAGGAFLIWMGVTLVRTQAFFAKRETPSPDILAVYQPVKVWSKGFFTNLLNPKALLFCSVFLPRFVSENDEMLWLHYLILGSILVGMGFVFDLLFIGIGSKMEPFFTHAKIQLIQRWVFALIFVGIGLYFIVDGTGWNR